MSKPVSKKDIKDFANLEDFYIHHMTCPNCGHQNMLSIQKGIRINDHAENTKCSHCGCRLRNSERIPRPRDVWL